MKISVIVPIYNCQEYLRACLDSILAQTHKNLQIILIDDGSTDGSKDICDYYATIDTRITTIHQINQGVSAARNTGISCANGDAIAFVDADDTIEKDLYETLSTLMLTYGSDVAICGYNKIFFDGSQKEILGTQKLITMNGIEASRCVLIGKYFTGSPWTKLYRRNLFENVCFDNDLKINEDILMNLLVFKKCNKIVFKDICKYNYFERDKSATRTTNIYKIKQDCVTAAEKFFSIYKETELLKTIAWRLEYALIDLYRTGLLYTPYSSKQERLSIHKRYKKIHKLSQFDLRSTLNYYFMLYCPTLYVKIYNRYINLRKENNDI